jgi:hypothetical protein
MQYILDKVLSTGMTNIIWFIKLDVNYIQEI